MKHTIIILSFFMLLSCSSNKDFYSNKLIDEAKTKEVFEHHFKSFSENDIEATMMDYTEESVVITPTGSFSGLAAIRKNLEGALKMFPKEITTSKVVNTTIKNDVAYIIWSAKTPQFELSFATDTFVIQNGKIVRQTFAGH